MNSRIYFQASNLVSTTQILVPYIHHAVSSRSSVGLFGLLWFLIWVKGAKWRFLSDQKNDPPNYWKYIIQHILAVGEDGCQNQDWFHWGWKGPKFRRGTDHDEYLWQWKTCFNHLKYPQHIRRKIMLLELHFENYERFVGFFVLFFCFLLDVQYNTTKLMQMVLENVPYREL